MSGGISRLPHVVVFGPTGCGKSTVGSLLAERLDAVFADGDDFHSAVNVAKMSRLEPLTDDDRWPWLASIGAWMGDQAASVVACSALRVAYRDALRAGGAELAFVYLSAPQNVLEQRVRERAALDGHFAGPGLVASQFAILEPLEKHERGVEIDVSVLSALEAADAAAAWIRGIG